MKGKWLVFFLILSLGGTFSFSVKAFEIKEDFPRLANYYLQPLILKGYYDNLAKYDLLILDVDVQTIDTNIFFKLKKIILILSFLHIFRVRVLMFKI